ALSARVTEAMIGPPSEVDDSSGFQPCRITRCSVAARPESLRWAFASGLSTKSDYSIVSSCVKGKPRCFRGFPSPGSATRLELALGEASRDLFSGGQHATGLARRSRAAAGRHTTTSRGLRLKQASKLLVG